MSATPARLLIIDDDEAILSLITDSLSPDYHIVAVQDWLQGTDLLMKERFDLLIVDLAMPIFDGMEFINKMRSDGLHRQTPVIVISAYSDLRDRLSSANVQAIIAKPFSLRHLTHTVGQVLAGGQV
jgi:two-component system, chemotaxis family, chemotaxis protein CheY